MKNLKTVDIKGKPYVEVNTRLKYFREHFKGYSLTTDIVYQKPSEVVTVTEKDGDGFKEVKKKKSAEICFMATIRNESGSQVATGHAMEKEDEGYINKTSYIENCETSAWGRALANFGIGIDNSVASADEVETAINKQG